MTPAQSIRPKQSLGQNFLTDDNIARKIVRSMEIGADDVVVEVGPGKGALTRFLAGNGKHLVAVEIDGRLVDDLSASFPPEQVTVVHRDFMEFSLAALAEQYGRPVRLAGNLPYHLTSPILFKAIEERTAVRDLTIMIQREVAQRIAARPGTKDFGILAVLTQAVSKPEYLFTVSPNCFFPKPKVDSAVLRLNFFPEAPHRFDEKIFTLVVKTTFGKRRKTLRNSLQFLPYDEATIEHIFRDNNAVLTRRPEQLTVEEFAALARSVEEIVKKTGESARP